ncbi:efflux transporter, RND family, MFP subunit [Chlorobium limicola DSM 245]|uniref:Efflux transporter, RND family, MFP subunit n=1 Tax=Chlorobium limicola (strain DSM 245 / NBRC 103803 / 6330) TaxID=290315 RepID=B3ED54_CHLL2|nr:efflux RND transporter periplasmic adaptor subunit [Chlorobium limicola]ACD90479.1 efflux transporter, RND family, MFP subunit [Chlorobium limicola DSM 245]
MVFSKTQRIILFSLFASALVLFFVFRPSPLPVDSGEVHKGALQVTLDAEGFTRVDERFVLAAPVSGMLMRIKLEEGGTVRKGDLVAALLPPELDSREYREASARAASAKALLNEALSRERSVRLDLEQVERRAKRYRNLYNEGAISKETFELAENEAGMRRKEVDAARSTSLSARYGFEAQQAVVDRQISGRPVQVFSPVDGKVLRIHEKSERVINAGTPLVDIGDPSAIEIVIDLLSSDAVRVKPGNPVIIEEWGGSDVLNATVKTIEPSAFNKISALGIEEKRVNIIAALNRYEPRLGDNFRVQAKIVLRREQSVLQVPVSSLFRGTREWKVFVIENGKAVEKTVEIGMRGAFQAQVLSGLKEGDKVVVHPTNELSNGMRVVIQK